MSIEATLQQSRTAALAMAVLETALKNEALQQFARIIEAHADMVLQANREDLTQQEGRLSPALFQRLGLDRAKLDQLIQGIADVLALPDPVGRVLSRTRLDAGLVLEKITVPLGVLAIIFESRPDVIPQILSLALKSGNAVVLKGGSEARQTNRAFMTLVAELNQACPGLPPHWALLLESREAVHELLAYPQYVNLVIPRGSNQLVQSIMAQTHIPVLGHADGVCHAYVHPSADIREAVDVVIDGKAQYPAACNALETLLVDVAIAPVFFEAFARCARDMGLSLVGCPETARILPGVSPATEVDWRMEYGDLRLAVRVVPDLTTAVTHINTYGSHHTDIILARDNTAIRTFMAGVDSASVFANASSRFADGFRFGLGAEIGISTAKTHARGPVGLEGLVIYKYTLQGAGHQVRDYVGEKARPFLHETLPVD